MEDASRNLYATQFHPEVRHTAYGHKMLENFLFKVCGLKQTWTMENIIDEKVGQIREQVGDKKVILALSGGVDSSVVAALVHRAIGDQLTCVFVNHGMLRKGEPEMVERVFRHQFNVPLVHVHAEERYATMLAGVTDPEQKRRLIGTEFWRVFFDEAQKIGDVEMLAQGTIYPDIIESGARKTGGKASTIKSHHNLIPFPEGVHFDLIEPLDHFFKDEVRELGVSLGLPASMVYRQPFPGPGLAIRIIGDVTPEKLEILKNADAIVREELDAYNERLYEETGERNSEHSCWQYFAVLPDIKSVGVMGDERTYQRPIIVRAVESSDAMTADWAKLPYEVIGKISSRIVDEVDGVNRVVYDVTPKPPATIEWE
jgi:GMP synthase (glutamine-hydrolysing)